MRLSGVCGSNVFVVGDNEVIIIDAGVDVDRVKSAVAGRKVLAILLTHGHFDHIFYLNDYISTFGAKVYTGERVREYLADPYNNSSKGLSMQDVVISDLSNFIFLSGDGVLTLGAFKIRYYSLSGHSYCDMVYEIGDCLYCGDLILGEYIGRYDLYGGDFDRLMASLKKIKSINFNSLCCGHENALSKAEADKVIDFYTK